MGFFKKLKQGLGVGTITFEIEAPTQVLGSAGTIEGTIVITAKSDQVINDLEMHLDRVQTWQERESYLDTSTNTQRERWVERSQSVTIGQWQDSTQFSMTTDEVKRIPFTLAFPAMDRPYGDANDSELWSMISSSWLYGNHWRNERIEYTLSGDADVEDAAFDKGDSQTIIIL